MQVGNVLHAARRKYRTQKLRKKSPYGHHRSTLSGYIFATNVHDDNRKKFINSNIFPTCSHDIVKFGPLAAEIGSLVWGTPSKFQRVSRLGFVTAATSLNGGQPNFARCLTVSCSGIVYMHFGGLLPPNGILPAAKFTLRPSLAFSYHVDDRLVPGMCSLAEEDNRNVSATVTFRLLPIP